MSIQFTAIAKAIVTTMILSISTILWSVGANFSVNKIFQDHMVLQHGVSCSVWGSGNQSEEVTVEIFDKKYTTSIDTLGKWILNIDPSNPGGPFEMRITSGQSNILINDIYFGDVWVCAGQSNMESPISRFGYTQQELGKADYPLLRQFDVMNSSGFEESDSITGKPDWIISSSETVDQYSAVGFFFARELQEKLKIPIGIVNVTWGGSRIEPWISKGALGITDARESYINQVRSDSMSLISKLGLKETDLALNINKPNQSWFESNYDDSQWLSHKIPQRWESAGYEYLNGIVYYRKVVEIKQPVPIDSKVSLSLGIVDESDITWINGVRIGGMIEFPKTKRVYRLPNDVLRQGKNTILVKVENKKGSGGLRGPDEHVFLQIGENKIDLSGDWRFTVGKFDFERGPDKYYGSLLYNTMVKPLTNYSVKGVVWYQGENNTTTFNDALQYHELFPKMISDWRQAWNDPELPFLYVQLSNYFAAPQNPEPSKWALLRESQMAALDLENVGQVVTIDIGDAKDIHPRNKQDVGYRLALAARKIAYGQEIVYSGPVFKSVKYKNNKAIIALDHVGHGLKSDLEQLKGFALASNDGVFHWASAKIIDKNKIEVWSDSIDIPVAVRYAWANNPGELNLINSAGLPASPFRTDSWNEN